MREVTSRPLEQNKEQEKEKNKDGKIMNNTPGTRVGPGGRDRTLALKCRKNARGSK